MEAIYKLTVKTLEGEVVPVEIGTDKNIRDLRELILNLTMETTNFHLLYKGRKMKDKVLLKDIIKDDINEFFMIGASITGGCVG